MAASILIVALVALGLLSWASGEDWKAEYAETYNREEREAHYRNKVLPELAKIYWDAIEQKFTNKDPLLAEDSLVKLSHEDRKLERQSAEEFYDQWDWESDIDALFDAPTEVMLEDTRDA